MCELIVSFCLQVPRSGISLYEGGKWTDMALTSSQPAFSISLHIVSCQDVTLTVRSGKVYAVINSGPLFTGHEALPYKSPPTAIISGSSFSSSL